MYRVYVKRIKKSRYQLRSSVSKSVPAPTDLLEKELGYSGTVPVISYSVTDGISITIGTINIFIAPPLVALSSNPITSAMTGICVVSDGVISAPAVGNIKSEQNVYRDVGGGSGIIASVAGTTNFLMFTTESVELPVGSAIQFFGNPQASYVQYVTSVKCADARYIHVWKALNVPCSIGTD